MVTFAQAQERAEEWVNGDVPAYQHREVRVREFELGFVVWAEDRPDGPVSDGGRQRLVIARDSGEATLWPGLPVGEVIRRYEEEYGSQEAPPAAPAPPERVDLNQTSFLLSPPEWLQDAADKLGIPDRRAERDDTPPPAPQAPSSFPPPAPIPSPSTPSQGGPVAYEPTASDGVPASSLQPPVGATPWAGTDVNADSDDAGVALPATVFAPPLSGADDEEELPPVVPADAPTALMSGGSALPKTAIAPSLGGERPPVGPPVPGPPVPGTAVPGPPVPGQHTPPPAQHLPPPAQHTPPPGPPGGHGAGDIADAATSKAAIAPRGPRGGTPPPPPGAPGTPGARPGAPVPPPSGPGAPGAPAGGYVPTQLVSQLGPPGAPQPPGPPAPPAGGGVHQAATMFADASSGAGIPQPPGPPGVPGAPQPPGPPGVPGAPVGQQPPPPQGATPPPGPGGVHHAATMLAGPAQTGPGAPQPPGPPGPPGPPMGAPPAYGYPQAPAGQPTVGPGYQAVLRFRAPDGSEQQLIRRSAPGTPHPEWQMLHELRAMNVPPQQVIELHTELESCELPGGYCARMIRETWPQVRITSVAPYGTDHASRQQGMQHLLTHQGELHQVADGPARPAPVRAPLPQMQPAPQVPPEALAEEMMQTFGPQGVLRFDQRAVSRQGVPEVVAMTLVWAGLPADFGPFFWAQPGQPVVPTLAELAAQRQVQPASDAGSYLVMGSDFGRAICVQYGTAHIVAVPVEAGPGGAPVPPQFVNTGLPEFVRCMALLGRMWRLRYGLNPEQAGRWTVDFQAQLVALDPAALASPESWWSVLLEQMWDGLI
ncbi:MULTISPECIES: SUKH-4 family immunity protein [unclassified Streptomyces]|uniref:SUKH-4 family immunity protein n=1 Tax=unclassified Streptomyces TaxID=2593676 RepID=UPI002E27E340|nr:SUKH-4 family immunity protein [Streptomyces sp. NBC_00441]